PHALMGTTLGDAVPVINMCRDLYWRKAQLRLGFKFGPEGFEPDATIRAAVGQEAFVPDGAPWPRYFTDKMPMNELHLPLLRLMFPDAPFIYVPRHPLDICVSTMSYLLANGGHYAESLDTIAEHYAGVDSVLQHYKAVLPMGNYKELRYENFVADMPAQLAA